jgi:hypothetical protein
VGHLRVVEPRAVVVPAKLRAANNLVLQLLAVVKVAIFRNIVVLDRLSEGVVVGGLRQYALTNKKFKDFFQKNISTL